MRSPLSNRTPRILIPRLEPRRKRDDLPRPGLGIVGIDRNVRPSGRDCAKSSNAVVSSS